MLKVTIDILPHAPQLRGLEDAKERLAKAVTRLSNLNSEVMRAKDELESAKAALAARQTECAEAFAKYALPALNAPQEAAAPPPPSSEEKP